MISAMYKAGLFDWWALLYNNQQGPQLLSLGDLQWLVSVYNLRKKLETERTVRKLLQ